MKPLDHRMAREDFLAVLKINFNRKLVVFCIVIGIMTYYCWSIAMFTLQFHTFTSYMWIFSTLSSFLISLVITPIVKVFLVNILYEYLMNMYMNNRIKKRKDTAVVCPEGTFN